ncbi:hypothetical protein HAX54_018015 [Datura stramonium]|uniref:Uncharacterized protein n=1 Tax=Datura stramonium TaxID=4076 RepID=A0ABS8Y4L4_DATST|nr:hypothetical protein [Datura stramonium]
MQNRNVEEAVYNSKWGLKIKHHEDNIKFLKARKTGWIIQSPYMQVALDQYQIASKSGYATANANGERSEEETIEHILKHEKICSWHLVPTKNSLWNSSVSASFDEGCSGNCCSVWES